MNWKKSPKEVTSSKTLIYTPYHVSFLDDVVLLLCVSLNVYMLQSLVTD